MKPFSLLLVCLFLIQMAVSQTNYDESQVPAFELPALLVTEDGGPISDSDAWKSTRRPELLEVFAEQMFGKFPEKEVAVSIGVIEVKKDALKGKSIRKQIEMLVGEGENAVKVHILVYLPAHSQGPVPLFLGMNFYGNHTTTPEGDVWLAESWIRNNEEFGITDNVATTDSRGVRVHRWPYEAILARGYGVATMYYGDVDPDIDDGFQNGIHPLFYKEKQDRPETDEWASIGAWSWSLSKALDYFEEDKDVNAERVFVIGHSRLGKTSLWAGATDERFAMVISNNSGCGGAALSKRKFGETLAKINDRFPHWFCENFKQYNGKEENLSFDQHMLIALAAPRPIYIASASKDQWADPKGEFLAGLYASPVYELFGKKGLEQKDMPPLNTSIGHHVGYHIRDGKHDITLFDWTQYMDFADKHFGKPILAIDK